MGSLKFVRVLAAGLLLAGCSGVVSGDARTVSVDTGYIGSIAPGTREWLSWPQARDHCAVHGGSPEIADLKGSVAIYKCVPDKQG
jgi:hypothetical protein